MKKLPPLQTIKVGGLVWRIIETPGTKNGPVLFMLPGPAKVSGMLPFAGAPLSSVGTPEAATQAFENTPYQIAPMPNPTAAATITANRSIALAPLVTALCRRGRS